MAHCESGEGLWLQGEAALQTHSFRDAEPQSTECNTTKCKEKSWIASQAAQTRHEYQPAKH